MSNIRALIVDDEPDICQLAEITLNRMNIDTLSAYNLIDAKTRLAEHEFNLCLTDMNLPDGNGIDLVKHIRKHFPHIPVAVITAYGNVESAVTALKAGAFDFIAKPIDLKVLRSLVESSLKLKNSTKTATSKQTDKVIIGKSAAIEQLNKNIAKLARSQAPIFIHGESGTGKELAARQIHAQSSRASQAFIPVNCGAIPTELMESEFFGHKKGSFTGASTDKDGLFKAADGGTLFLDEVADLPLQMQVKLLRAIQEKTIRTVGDTQEQSVDVRILSASHKNLADLVKQGKFREDLYYRINVIELKIPTLRERSEDIPLLVDFLLTRLATKAGYDIRPTFANETLQALEAHDYPGNVRELENILERAMTLSENNVIHRHDLQLLKIPTLKSTPSPSSITDISKAEPTSSLLAEQEKDSIIKALEQNRWNKTAAAKQLGLTLRQLRYRLKKLDLE